MQPQAQQTLTEITGVSSTNVLVLDDSAYVRFIPDSTNDVTAELTFLAWDQIRFRVEWFLGYDISPSNQGDAGAYSSAEDTFTVEVTAFNDRPDFADSSDAGSGASDFGR